jgi:cytidylate kinase
MDGRDIGTVVFPNAELKLFLTASASIRAKRRYKELLDKGENISFDDVLENVKSRDFIDSTRNDSPLIKADDAIELDNSELSLEQQFDIVLSLAKDKIEMINNKP